MRYIKPYPILPTLAGQPFSCTVADAEQKRADLGDVAFEMVMQCHPVSEDSQILKPRHFPIVQGIDLNHVVCAYMSCDTSMGSSKNSDPTAIVSGLLMDDYSIRIVDVFEERMVFGLQKQVIAERYFAMHRKYNFHPLLIIEKASSGEPLASELKEQYGDAIAIELHPAHKSKYLRGAEVQGTCMAHTVHLLDGMPLLSKTIVDLSNYPLDQKNDHIPDAFCQLVSHVRKIHKPIDKVEHKLISNNPMKQFANMSQQDQIDVILEVIDSGAFNY